MDGCFTPREARTPASSEFASALPAPFGFTVLALRAPMSQDVLQCQVAGFPTLREVLGNPSERYAITVDGVPSPPWMWALQRPLPGQVVTICALPAGDKARSVLLTIGLIAAGIFGGGAIASYFGGLNAFGAAAPALLTNQALWAAGIFAVGSLAINALVAPPVTSAAPLLAPRQLKAIAGTRNDFRPFGTVPLIYGRVRVFPPHAAQPFTEIVGDDQYANFLFALGVGEHRVSEARIGDTALLNYQGVELEQTTTPSFPRVIEQALTTQLEDPLTPGTPTVSAVFTTALNATHAAVDLMLPTGIMYLLPTGDRLFAEIDFNVEFRVAGSGGAWTAVRNHVLGGTDYRGWTLGTNSVLNEPGATLPATVGAVSVSTRHANWFRVQGKTRDGMRFGLRWAFATPGQYEVRVTRSALGHYNPAPVDFNGSDEELGRYLQTFQWTALKSYDANAQAVTTSHGVEYLRLRIKASDQLNGVLDQFSVLAERKLRSWNGATFNAPAVTRSPAWAYLDALTGPGNARPITDPAARVHLDDLLVWATRATSAGNFCDKVVDTAMGVWQLLGAIAAAGRAGRSLRDAKHTVVYELATDVPSQLFTPRNSFNYRLEHRYVDMPHALRCRFVSADNDYEQDERVVYDDGFDASNATKFEAVEFDFVTDAEQVWRFGRYHLAQARLRPRLHVFDVDIEHLASVRGDLVHIQHDVPLHLVGGGRVVRVWGNRVRLDEGFTIVTGTSYTMTFRVADTATGAVRLVQHPVTAFAGVDVREFTVTGQTIDGQIRDGDLAVLGETGSQTVALRVVNVVPRPGGEATLTCVDAAPAILTADVGPIPDYDPQVTLPKSPEAVVPPAPVIVSVLTDANAATILPSGDRAVRLQVAYRLPGFRGTTFGTVELRIREPDGVGDPPWRILPAQPMRAGAVAVPDVEVGQTYELQLRAITAFGTPGPWSATATHTVPAVVLVPPAVSALTATGGIDRVILTLDLAGVDVAGISHVRVTFAEVNDFNDALAIFLDIPVPNRLETLDELRLAVAMEDGRRRYFWVQLVDRFRNLGALFPADLVGGVEGRAASINQLQMPEINPDPDLFNQANFDFFTGAQGQAAYSATAGPDGSGTITFTHTDQGAVFAKRRRGLDVALRVGDSVEVEALIRYDAAFNDQFQLSIFAYEDKWSSTGIYTGTSGNVTSAFLNVSGAVNTWHRVRSRMTISDVGVNQPVRCRLGCSRLGNNNSGSIIVSHMSAKVLPNIQRIDGIPTFANNAAALAGGLVIGDVYQTSGGSLLIVV